MAAAKRTATRAARYTVGPVQQKAVTGNVGGIPWLGRFRARGGYRVRTTTSGGGCRHGLFWPDVPAKYAQRFSRARTAG